MVNGFRINVGVELHASASDGGVFSCLTGDLKTPADMREQAGIISLQPFQALPFPRIKVYMSQCLWTNAYDVTVNNPRGKICFRTGFKWF